MRKLALIALLFVVWTENKAFALAGESTPSKQRHYPGGRDEEDLKVQPELPQPTVTVHRRSIEEQVLKKLTEETASKSDEKNTKRTQR